MNRNEKVAICILCRDVEKKINKLLKEVDYLSNHFDESRVFIFENNSKDKTKDFLYSYNKSSNNVTLVSFDNKNLERLDRIVKLTMLRNMVISTVNKSNYNPELIILIDGDIEFKAKNVIKIIDNAPSDYGALFANGRFYINLFGLKINAVYYDLYALLLDDLSGIALRRIQMFDNRDRLNKLFKSHDYVPCFSAFGGIGIYKYSEIKDKEYQTELNPRDENLGYLCEHLSINTKINSPKYIAKKMLVKYEPLTIIDILNLLNTSIYLRKLKKVLQSEK